MGGAWMLYVSCGHSEAYEQILTHRSLGSEYDTSSQCGGDSIVCSQGKLTSEEIAKEGQVRKMSISSRIQYQCLCY